jgi:uncharacterized cofD-like protein
VPTEPDPRHDDASVIEWLALLARPGIGVKRWLIAGFVGLLILSMGFAFALSVSVGETLVDIARRATFANSMDPFVRGGLTALVGLALAGISMYMLYKQLAFGARYSQGSRGIIESLASHHVRSTGPKIVVVGGGTGLSTVLRGLKGHTDNLSAVVTVADDGGSSGRLRSELGIPPPGDARQCLIALSDSEPLMERLLSYRFEGGSGLEGHNFGNLLIASLVDIEGDFPHALESAAKLLSARGNVLPSSTSTDMRLAAKTVSGNYLIGESTVGHAGEGIESIWIEPPNCAPNPSVLTAIAEADLIVIGPGSLYTSILPNFLVPGVSDAVRTARVPVLLVCNIATQPGETDEMSALDHLREFERHSGVTVSHFVVNTTHPSTDPDPGQPPQIRWLEEPSTGTPKIVGGEIVSPDSPTHHDPGRLARLILAVLRKP